ncbi:MAG TPA: hypothetical protein DHV62_06795, partial [Elusimicrobia bacterium]|nr:hypothetical protein [Elusimicrobiota bacterium]
MKKFAVLLVGLMVVGLALPARAAITVSGFAQGQIVNDASLVGKELYFTGKRARIIAKGDIGDKVGVFCQIETLTDKINVLDLVVDYDLGAAGKVAVGRFCIPVGLQNPVSPYNLHTINYAQVVQKLVGSGARDFGLRWTGKYNIVDWAFAYINGSDGGTTVVSATEDNDVKDIILRVGASNLGITGLGAGVSIYNGKAGAAKTKKSRTGIDAKYEKDAIYAQLEYIMGEDGTTKKAGYYLEAGYKIGNIQPIVRYDSYDGNTDKEDASEITITAVGANYYIGKAAKVQLIYEMKADKAGAALADTDNDAL